MRVAALVMTVVLLPVLAARGEEPKKDALDKKVLDILKEVGAIYKNAKSFHCEAEMETNTTEGDKKQQNKVATTIDYQKLNLFAMHARNLDKKDAGIDVVSDGKKLFAHMQRLHQYTEADAPTDLSELGRGVLRFGVGNIGLVTPNVLNEDPYEALMEGVTECSYAGKEQVGGTAAHHLKFVQPGMDWELWVAVEGKPLVLKAVTTISSDERKAVTTDTYKSWKFDEAPEKDTFTFKPPADANKVEEFGPRE